MVSKFSVVILVFFLSACSSNQRAPGQTGVIVDTKGIDMSSYEADLDDCYSYADQVPVGEKAATGAVIGAAVGGVIGAVVGDSRTAERAATVGAVSGGVKGTGRGLSERDLVVKRCMQGRGYRVLN